MTPLIFCVALLSTVIDATGTVLLKRNQTVKGIAFIAIHSIIDIFVIKFFPAHVFTALSGIGVMAAAVISNEDITGAVWAGIGILVGGIVMMSILMAEMPKLEENKPEFCSVPPLFATCAALVMISGLIFSRSVYLNPLGRSMSEKLALIVVVGLTSASNLQYVEIFTRCNRLVMLPAIIFNGLAELIMVKCSLMMSPVTLHVPVSFFLWQFSGFATDLRMAGKSDALLFSIIPALASVLGVTMIVAGSVNGPSRAVKVLKGDKITKTLSDSDDDIESANV